MKNCRGITIISLIITIVVMLILAGIALVFSVGEEGIIKKAETVDLKGKIEEIKEKVALEYNAERIEVEKNSNGSMIINRLLERIVNLKEKEYNEEIDEVKIVTQNVIMYTLSEKLGGLSFELDILTGKIGEYVDDLERVVGSSDLWILDSKKINIIGYNGTGEQLKDVIVPNVVVVGKTEYKITGISGLNNIDFEGTLTIASNLSIGINSLRNCSKIKKLIIGDNVSIVPHNGDQPLSNCVELETIEMGRNIKMNTAYDYEYTATWYSFMTGNSKLSKVTIESLSQVGSKAFASIGSALQGTVIVNEGVKGIGINAFNGCTNVEKIVLPSTIEYVGENAFNNCTICEINFPENVTTIGAGAFNNCKNMKLDVTIKSGTTLGSKAFNNSGITNLKIEDGVSLPVSSFYNCDNLNSVNLGNNVILPLSDNRYEPSFSCCDSLVEVNMGENINIVDGPSYYLVFYKNPKLETVTVKSLSGVGYGAFQQVGKALKGKVVINEKEVIKISDYAFNGCINVEEIVLPEGVEYIGKGAFYNCTSLSKVNIPTTVITIEESAFYNCSNVKMDVTIKTGTTLGSSAFNNSGITNVIIEDGISLPMKSFYNCDNLNSVSIGNNVTIPLSDNRYEPSFSYCDNLVEVHMGENIKIGDGPSYYLVFYKNPKLETVTVKSLSEMGYGAFQQVGKALKGTITINNLEKIGQNAFAGCSSIEKISIKMTKEQWESVNKGTGWANGVNTDVINNIEFIQ